MDIHNKNINFDDLFPELIEKSKRDVLRNPKDSSSKRKVDWSKSYLNPEVAVTPKKSRRQEKKSRKEERGKLKKEWFGVKKAEITDKLKNDLEALKNRSALDTKRFYKRNGAKVGEYFHVGRVIEAPEEFYSSRIRRKERKSIAEDFMKEAAFTTSSDQT